MKVIVYDEPDTVLLSKDYGPEKPPCSWKMECPVNKINVEVECFACPANNISQKMTHAEAVKWWNESEI